MSLVRALGIDPERATRVHQNYWLKLAREGGQSTVQHLAELEPLRRYTCPDYPGWNMKIPDVLRADVFLRELRAFEKKGSLPNGASCQSHGRRMTGITVHDPASWRSSARIISRS